MSVPHPFRSRNLTLRAIEADDVSAMHDYINQPDLAGRRYLTWGTPEFAPLSKKQIEHIVGGEWANDKNALHLAVVLNASGQVIGHAACDWGWDTFCPSLSLVIAPNHERKGYGSEVMRLLLYHAFGYMPAHSVSCWVADWNESGLAFVKSHGFNESGRMRRAGLREGKPFDMIIADILRPEWLAETGGGSHAA